MTLRSLYVYQIERGVVIEIPHVVTIKLLADLVAIIAVYYKLDITAADVTCKGHALKSASFAYCCRNECRFCES